MLNLLSPVCVNQRTCNRLCADNTCPFDPIVCSRHDCRCIQNHRDCQKLIYWQNLVEHYERKQEQNCTQYVKYIHFSLSQLLIEYITILQNQLSKFRFQQMSVGLNQKQKELLKRIKKKEKLTTKLVHDVIQSDQKPMRIVENPIQKHQHSIKVIKHMMKNFIEIFRQAFALETVEDDDKKSSSFEVSRMLDFQPELHKKSKQISVFNLSFQNNSPSSIVNLEDFGFVNELSLRACSSKQLKLASQLFMELQKLNLQDCGINLQCIRSIGGFKKLQYIDLHKNKIEDDGLIELSKLLPQLKGLGLRDTGIADRGLITMSSNLRFLNELYISDNSIQKEGIQILGKNCQYLQTLFLCNNHLGDEVVSTLLNDLNALQVLSLKNNNLHDQTIVLLTMKFPKIFALYLGENHLTDLACEHLCQLQYVQALFLCDNKITQKGVDDLLKSLKSVQFLGIGEKFIIQSTIQSASKKRKNSKSTKDAK